MFTGIIEATAPVLAVERSGRARRVRIGKPATWKLAKGQSVSVDGICSTVVAHALGSFDVEYMPVTLAKTTASLFTEGHIADLERSLKFGDPVDGHFVQGHIDGRGEVVRVAVAGDSVELDIRVPKTLMRFVAPTGSIAVNGVSLTVANRHADTFTIALIPHTLSHTNLGTLKCTDAVNIETDLFARIAVAARRSNGTVAHHEANGTRSGRSAARRFPTPHRRRRV
jgi:riboflavin synthase alpha subunit